MTLERLALGYHSWLLIMVIGRLLNSIGGYHLQRILACHLAQ
jgi:hypothetical protein